jgi:hypothetical protein
MEDYGSTPGSAGTVCGNCSVRAALKREQRERLESNHSDKLTTGRKVRRSTDVASTVLGKEEMAVHL